MKLNAYYGEPMYIGRKGEGGMTDRRGKIFATAEIFVPGIILDRVGFFKNSIRDIRFIDIRISPLRFRLDRIYSLLVD